MKIITIMMKVMIASDNRDISMSIITTIIIG